MQFIPDKAIKELGLNRKLVQLTENTLDGLNDIYKVVDNTVFINQAKVIHAMQKARLSYNHFIFSTGYGYGDISRDIVDKIYSYLFNTEDAIVRPNFVSGTHALSTVLFGLLRPGDELIYATGVPYDTMKTVIDGRVGEGSLKEYNVIYKEIALRDDGTIDIENLLKNINSKTKVVMFQRSKGYSWRPSIEIDSLEMAIRSVKEYKNDVICAVDNCYGEFVEEKEPSDAGAGIIAGSLIKNPGGGLAISGGYIAGRKDLIEKISYRYTAPGLGKHMGTNFGNSHNILHGLFLAPHVVGQAVKGAIFSSRLFEKLGFDVSPAFNAKRTDIIQAVKLNDPKKLISFCQGIQKSNPVDSFVKPEPWDMPGYEDKIIMSSGGFVDGASIELSADAPLREPYILYIQGGVTLEHYIIGILLAIQNMIDEKLITI
ncbi:MAG: methionine gamma-lyase family protein [Thermoanaerobacteraceae bacterium]|nr:methionine gamma-lyase family protein [Thermoanaerobacteraceae bacterium]